MLVGVTWNVTPPAVGRPSLPNESELPLLGVIVTPLYGPNVRTTAPFTASVQPVAQLVAVDTVAVLFCLTASLRASVMAVERSNEALRVAWDAIMPENDGTAMVTRIARMASVTISSVSVNPWEDLRGAAMAHFQQLDEDGVLAPVFVKANWPQAVSFVCCEPCGVAVSWYDGGTLLALSARV